MALIRANSGSGGGGNSEKGTITVTTGEQTFNWQSLTQKPTKLYVYKFNNPIASGDMMHIYDEDISSSNQILVYNYNGSAYISTDTYPSTTDDRIQEITASGFKLKTSDATWVGTYTYVAIV